MQRVGSIDLSAIANLAKGRKRSTEDSVPMVNGMPEDATICPWCLGRRDDCRKCGGTGTVCPTCRGARLQIIGEATRPSIVACPDCTDWADQREHKWDEHGYPQYTRTPLREAAVIRRYWQRRESEAA
jgi:hypothetical protein